MPSITLRPINLHWILNQGDDVTDLCAHAAVEFRIGSLQVCSEADGEWTVSAAAIHLLRTLTMDHTLAAPVAEHLIPCCGHFMVAEPDADFVDITGCNRGVDWDVRHNDRMVELGRLTANCETAVVPFDEWERAVCWFADEVEEFYLRSALKRPCDEFAELGFNAMKAEWAARRKNRILNRAAQHALIQTEQH